MTPEAFIAKWRNVEATERSASHSHFLDLCRVLEVDGPFDADPTGRERYGFEKQVTKPDGSTGYADVWKRDCFAWEYKGDRKNLVAAYSQLKGYADALENPPLLIVSDMKEIRIHTNFTNTPSVRHDIALAQMYSVEERRKLRWAFTDPERLRPADTRDRITTEAAADFAAIAQKLRDQKYDARRVAHFLNRIVFCLFVEDIGLLPDRVFADIIEEAIKRPDDFEPMLRDLFRAMREDRGRFGMIPIPWFNGGLFDDDDVLPLGFYEVRALADAAKRDWSYIDPSIFGTLFEKGLDPARRKEMANLFDATRPADDGPGPQLPGLLDSPAADKGVGIHYTDPDTIMKLIEPVVLRPLRAEWQAVKDRVRERRAAKDRAKSDAARTRMENEARDAWMRFRRRLGEFRVLDPACGSGNFLYLALAGLKDLDQEVLEEGRALDLPDDGQRITPESVLGIEINPYAAELARVTIWIGELQWQFGKGLQITRRPILDQLRGIECRDALIGPDGNEAAYPVITTPTICSGEVARGGRHRRQPAVPWYKTHDSCTWRRIYLAYPVITHTHYM